MSDFDVLLADIPRDEWKRVLRKIIERRGFYKNTGACVWCGKATKSAHFGCSLPTPEEIEAVK